MTGQFWLTGEQAERLKRYFPEARGTPRVDDRRVLRAGFKTTELWPELGDASGQAAR